MAHITVVAPVGKRAIARAAATLGGELYMPFNAQKTVIQGGTVPTHCWGSSPVMPFAVPEEVAAQLWQLAVDHGTDIMNGGFDVSDEDAMTVAARLGLYSVYEPI